MFRLRHVCALLSQRLVPGATLKGGQNTTRARKSRENKCEGFLHGSLSRVGKIGLTKHPDNPHLTTTTRHVMVGITRSKVFFFESVYIYTPKVHSINTPSASPGTIELKCICKSRPPCHESETIFCIWLKEIDTPRK